MAPTDTTQPTRLNLGCGTDIRPGYVNLDSADLPGVDVVHDLNEIPLPFADGSFEEIVCQDVLEHVDLIAVLGELHRILRPGGRLVARSPHYTSSNFYIDPTHVSAFSIDTLRMFVPQGLHSQRGYYFPFAFSAIADARITFLHKKTLPWNMAVERLVNRSDKTQRFYEQSALSGLFPALNVEVTLVR